ncbi:MAG TPA: glycosyltransferase family 4 protein [Candidatus Sulfotelmatobacter sp.]|nr:glycosyltransferase family 4 protein [Candidatus Sulfotelmatobacter sp.]
MKRRVVIMTEIIAPYRIPVFNALADSDEIDPHVVFLSETDSSLRQWRVYKEEIRFSYEVLPSWRRRVGKYNFLLNRGLRRALKKAKPQAIVVGGYSYFASWSAALWARRHGVPLLLWSESNAQDKPRWQTVELLKERYARMCRAFVAAGKSSTAYLEALGANERSIFVAPDAVDIDYYSLKAAQAREQPEQTRRQFGLPQRYFLNVGRMVREKGVFDLLTAYATLDEPMRSQIGLVFVGDGSARPDLTQRAAELSLPVTFCGWRHREEMPAIYALAEALVFPTYSDPWGLVVNEAMACGLPIIASKVAGCVADLVEDGGNGLVVDAGDIEGLAAALRKLAEQPKLSARFGEISVRKIQAYSPETCAEGFVKAVSFACNGTR